MRTYFDDQLNQLNREMIQMGSMIEQAIERVCDVLRIHDVEAAKAIVRGDSEIDRKERDIEALCLRLILMQQPVASDLRMVSSALKMITDMERIGDQASDIAEIISMPIEEEIVEKPAHLLTMGESAAHMVHKAVDAYVSRDLSLAQEVIESDDIVDNLFIQVKEEIQEQIRTSEDPGMQLLDTLMIAKYFERIADHAVNIAEWVEYAVTGIYKGEAL
ncbi:MAG: phosphate signaling complex protein PhoU [Christensenellales bacterium]|jgi:phosphate transport system protein|nr:phosphate signaling complex protein PhoU [Christensenellaceae bacterium]